MADPVLAVVRVVHIAAAIVWIGGGTLWGMVVMPTLGQLGPTLPKGAIPTLGNKVVKIFPAAGLLTLLSGLAVFYLLGGMSPGRADLWAMTIWAALAITVVVVAIAYGFTLPTWRKISAAMGAPGPPSPATQALMGRMKMLSMLNLVLGWLVVGLMVMAVSVRLG